MSAFSIESKVYVHYSNKVLNMNYNNNLLCDTLLNKQIHHLLLI